MISKIFGQFLGGIDEVESENVEELLESEDGDWVVINIQANTAAIEDPLENLLIEHPSMSVYQQHQQRMEEEEDDHDPRLVPISRDISWHLDPHGVIPFSVQRARGYGQRRNLSRSALHRQNLVRTRYCPSERRYGHFKQPSQRLYNY